MWCSYSLNFLLWILGRLGLELGFQDFSVPFSEMLSSNLWWVGEPGWPLSDSSVPTSSGLSSISDTDYDNFILLIRKTLKLDNTKTSHILITCEYITVLCFIPVWRSWSWSAMLVSEGFSLVLVSFSPASAASRAGSLSSSRRFCFLSSLSRRMTSIVQIAKHLLECWSKTDPKFTRIKGFKGKCNFCIRYKCHSSCVWGHNIHTPQL